MVRRSTFHSRTGTERSHRYAGVMIEAGERRHIGPPVDRWVFLDVGFSEKKKTCGLALEDAAPQTYTFNAAKQTIIERIRQWSHESNLPVSLVIEAPLSVSFDMEGNPKRRTIERNQDPLLV